MEKGSRLPAMLLFEFLNYHINHVKQGEALHILIMLIYGSYRCFDG